MNEIIIKRFPCIIMSLFPALWGIFSLLNNTADFSGTAENAIRPLLAMSDTYGIPGQTWRAITASWVPYAGLAVITAMETLAGVLATIGFVKMVVNLRGSYAKFSSGKNWTILGACCAVAVWGIGFMVIAGDWFMAWETKENSLNTQLGALLYALPSMMCIVIMFSHRESDA
ncbi:DUF2165 family protein [Brucella pseudintermedia]|uniref:DUF2165 family protein n=1 Tax=Brucella pseudintermedia TaxID=370111 RepID=UPI001589BEFE|nr:DUF2165 family protein [Brucella pseudintermedia]